MAPQQQTPPAAPGASPVMTGTPTDPGTQQGDALDELDAALGEGENATGAEGEGQHGEQWTPPTREQWDAAQAQLEAERAKLKRARQQAQRLREGAKAIPAASAPVEGQEASPAGADTAQIAVWQTRAVRAAAKAQLLGRGADPDMVDLALARLRAEQVDFDTDDEPLLDTWLDEMEDRYPKLFAKALQTGARPVGGLNQAGATARPAPRTLSLGEQIIANSQKATRR
jgi:hypothetical protein